MADANNNVTTLLLTEFERKCIIVSWDKRGPYCFTCDATMDPSTCNDVTICQESEECIVFVSQDLTSSSQTVYKSMCESKAVLVTLPLDTSLYKIQPEVRHCVFKFTHITKIGTCSSAGGDLVVLDNKDEAILLNTILSDSHYNHQTGYWIGARDFDLTNFFTWVTNTTVDLASGDWFPGKPKHHDGVHDQNCANMWRGSSHNPQDYQWHDDYSSKPLAFICQQS